MQGLEGAADWLRSHVLQNSLCAVLTGQGVQDCELKEAQSIFPPGSASILFCSIFLLTSGCGGYTLIYA